jgi:hypothetical protein
MQTRVVASAAVLGIALPRLYHSHPRDALVHEGRKKYSFRRISISRTRIGTIFRTCGVQYIGPKRRANSFDS